MSNKIDLSGRNAVITGGAQGIGRAITERFLESGAAVAIWDRDKAFADKTAKELAGRFIGSRAEGQDLLVRPVNVKDLNAMIDTLRAVPVEIAAIEPVRATMEDAFLSIINGQEDA